MSPRIFLIDDHPIVRQALRRLLEQDGLEVVGEACHGAEAVRLARELYADVVVLDVSRPASRCLDAAREIVRTVPVTGAILIAFEEYLVARAFQTGISGYVLETRVVEELPQAIRAVAGGSIYLSPGLSWAIVKACLTAIEHVPSGT